MHTPKSSPARRPDRASSVGTTTDSIEPGQHRAAHDDDLGSVLASQWSADLLADAAYEAQVEAAVRVTWRAYADQH